MTGREESNKEKGEKSDVLGKSEDKTWDVCEAFNETPSSII